MTQNHHHFKRRWIHITSSRSLFVSWTNKINLQGNLTHLETQHHINLTYTHPDWSRSETGRSAALMSSFSVIGINTFPADKSGRWIAPLLDYGRSTVVGLWSGQCHLKWTLGPQVIWETPPSLPWSHGASSRLQGCFSLDAALPSYCNALLLLLHLHWNLLLHIRTPFGVFFIPSVSYIYLFIIRKTLPIYCQYIFLQAWREVNAFASTSSVSK